VKLIGTAVPMSEAVLQRLDIPGGTNIAIDSF